MSEEGLAQTENKKIFIGKPVEFSVPEFLDKLKDLVQARYNNDPDIVAKVETMFPTFHPTGKHPKEAEINKRAKETIARKKAERERREAEGE